MKPWMKTTLRRTAWTVGTLLVLLAAFHGVENWRGSRAWKAWLAERAALGEARDLEAYAPPQVPDAENFARAPVVAASLGAVKSTRSEAEIAALGAIGGIKSEEAGNWRLGRPLALDESRVKDLEAKLTELKALLEDWSEAARRPACRALGDYRAWDQMPAFIGVRNTMRVFRLRALLALKQGCSEEALEDTLTILRVAQHLSKEPHFISQLLRLATVNIALQPVWEGILDHRWNEAQLARLQAALQGMDLLAGMRLGWRFERLGGSGLLLRQLQGGDMSLATLTGNDSGKLQRFASVVLIPRGWMYQNLVNVEKIHLQQVEEGVDPQQHRVRRPATAFQARRTPYTFLAGLAVPAFGGQNIRCARAQVGLDQALIACALERHRLAKGAYPTSLSELGALLPEPRKDVVTGKAMVYRLDGQGSYRLYAVGWDGLDEGGKRTQAKDTDISEPGDWVWK